MPFDLRPDCAPNPVKVMSIGPAPPFGSGGRARCEFRKGPRGTGRAATVQSCKGDIHWGKAPSVFSPFPPCPPARDGPLHPPAPPARRPVGVEAAMDITFTGFDASLFGPEAGGTRPPYDPVKVMSIGSAPSVSVQRGTYLFIRLRRGAPEFPAQSPGQVIESPATSSGWGRAL